jgi:DNA polymerase-1
MEENKKVLIIIDGNALIHRAYHALPPLTTKKGELVNAVYGFLLVFLKAIKEFSPEYIAATFDFPAPTFRHDKYKLYKANRVKAPDDLYNQIPKVKEILKNFNIQIFEKKGYEADDIIGTISKIAPRKQIFPQLQTIILSGDMDTLQLVDKNTKVFALKKGVKDTVLFDEEKVKEKYDDIGPENIVDFKALRGDPSDNIPGVFGVGEKTAIFLIKEFENLENLYDELKNNTDKAKKLKPALRERLLNYKEQAYVSKMLAQINPNVPIDFDLDKCKWGDYDREKIKNIFEEYEFKTLIFRLEEKKDIVFEGAKQDNKNQQKKDKFSNNLSLW